MSDFSRGLNLGFVTGLMQNTFGYFNLGYGCCHYNSLPEFFVPYIGGQTFIPYVNNMPDVNLPIFNFENNYTCDFSSITYNSYNNISNMAYKFNYPTFTMSITDTFTRTVDDKKASYTPITRTSGDFDKMLAHLLKSEGGYVKNDNGSASNKGIKKETYNAYRDKKGLPRQDVSLITDEEVKDIYYNDFYLKSGADKIKDVRLAFYVFDTAVNCGLGGLKEIQKKCKNPNDPAEFEEVRLKRYVHLATVVNPQKYGDDLEGWKKRLENGNKFLKENFAIS